MTPPSPTATISNAATSPFRIALRRRCRRNSSWSRARELRSWESHESGMAVCGPVVEVGLSVLERGLSCPVASSSAGSCGRVRDGREDVRPQGRRRSRLGQEGQVRSGLAELSDLLLAELASVQMGLELRSVRPRRGSVSAYATAFSCISLTPHLPTLRRAVSWRRACGP